MERAELDLVLETAEGAKAVAEPAKMTERADVNFILI